MGGRLTGTTYQPLSPLHPVLPSAAFVRIGYTGLALSLSSLSLSCGIQHDVVVMAAEVPLMVVPVCAGGDVPPMCTL